MIYEVFPGEGRTGEVVAVPNVLRFKDSRDVTRLQTLGIPVHDQVDRVGPFLPELEVTLGHSTFDLRGGQTRTPFVTGPCRSLTVSVPSSGTPDPCDGSNTVPWVGPVGSPSPVRLEDLVVSRAEVLFVEHPVFRRRHATVTLKGD